MDDDTNLIICQRVSDRPADVPSTIQKCAGCGQNVYVAHTTLEYQARQGKGKKIVFSCLQCLPTFDVDLSETMLPSPEQIQEVEGVIGRKLTPEDIAEGMERFKTMYRAGRSSRN